jgi:hypothetical protein
MSFESLSDPNPDLVLDTKEITKPDTDGKKMDSGGLRYVGRGYRYLVYM